MCNAWLTNCVLIMNVDTQMDGHIHKVEVNAKNAVISYHNIYSVAINVILWLVIGVDVIDYNDIVISFSFHICHAEFPKINTINVFCGKTFQIKFNKMLSWSIHANFALFYELWDYYSAVGWQKMSTSNFSEIIIFNWQIL